LVAVEDLRRRTLGISRWWDKFLESAPLFILRHLGHLGRQLFDGRPLTIQLVRCQPLLAHREVVSGSSLVEEQRPLCVNHELQIRVWNYRKNWIAIHAQQNRRAVTDKNLRRILIQLHTGRRRVLWRRRDQMKQGNLES